MVASHARIIPKVQTKSAVPIHRRFPRRQRLLGVTLLSTGSGLCCLAYATTQEAAARLLATDHCGILAPANALPHGAVNRLLAPRDEAVHRDGGATASYTSPSQA